MTAPPIAVEVDFDLRATVVDGLAYRSPRHVPAVLRWSADDPWAVQLDFVRGPVWTVGWDLLEAAARCGGRRSIGDGDVRIRRASVRHFEITLSNPQYSATFTADPFDLVAFVDAVQPRQQAAARPWIPDTAHALLAAIDHREETR